MHPNEKAGWKVIGIFFGAVLLVALLVLPALTARRLPTRVRCLQNLRRIEWAKAEWAKTNPATEGALVITNQILPMLPGRQFPVCPEGGIYTLGGFGEKPTCSQPGHSNP